MSSENENRALNHLRRIIQLGHYPEGAKLPTERELAVELSVGRGPIRRALAALEADGRVSRHVGQGTYVGNRPATARSEPPSNQVGAANPADIMETRLTIEPRLAAMAAVRASEEDINYLKLCTAKSDASENWTVWDRWDATFHRTIALSARNTLLAAFVELINKARRSQYGSQARKSSLDDSWRAVSMHQHRVITEAIAARDPQAAAKAMRHHLNSVEERIFGDPDDLAEFTERL